jgi:hypothetical protein
MKTQKSTETTAPKLTFESKLNSPKLIAKPGTDEVGKWYCDRCGSANPDQNMFCQWC